MDILYESPGTVSAYADDALAAPIVDSVTAGVRGLLGIPAADAGLRVRVAREQFGGFVTGTWRYLTADKIQVWGRWAYPAADPAALNAFVQYSYKGPWSGNVADYVNQANYVISEESRIYANSASGPLNFVNWLPGRTANFFFTALNPRAVDSLRTALGSMPNVTNTGDSFSGDFSTAPGLSGVRPVVDLVRTVNQLSRAWYSPVRAGPAGPA